MPLRVAILLNQNLGRVKSSEVGLTSLILSDET